MKQIWPNYSYSPTTNVLTLTGLNIDRDQLLLVTAADRGRIMYNFADSSVTASAFTSGANTALTLVATTAGLTTTAALVIYYDDQVAGIAGTVTANAGGDFANSIETVGDVSNVSKKIAVQLYDDTGTAVGIGPNPLPVSGFSENEQAFGSIPLVPFDEGVGSGRAVVAKIINNNGQIEEANPFAISGTVTANPTGIQTIAGSVTLGASTSQIGSVTASISGTVPISISSVTVGNSITIGSCVTHGVTISNTSVTVNGSITANLAYSQTAVSLSSITATAIPIVLPTNGIYGGTLQGYNGTNTYIHSGIQAIGNTSLASATSLPVSLTTLPALVAGTAQIGSVTASISGTVPISISSVTIGSCVTHGVTIANSVVTFYPMQGTSVSNTNFTSITASTTLVSAVANREVLTVFNEGAGNLHISPGSTCTTISYQVRLSSGDYWECPAGQLSLAHTAVFATAGTARVTQVS